MKKQRELPDALTDWTKIPSRIRTAIRGLREEDLDLTGGGHGLSIREAVHHLVEANLIASNMIIAALATDGYRYDWTWVNPSKSWMSRLGYDKADIEPAISALRALCQHLTQLLAIQPLLLDRTLKLNDKPGGARYVITVAQILRQEVEHANEHIADIRDTRATHVR